MTAHNIVARETIHARHPSQADELRRRTNRQAAAPAEVQRTPASRAPSSPGQLPALDDSDLVLEDYRAIREAQ